MIVLQIFILLCLILTIIFSSINIMDTYSKEAKEHFKTQRNFSVIITLIIFTVLYFAGTFNLILPNIIK